MAIFYIGVALLAVSLYMAVTRDNRDKKILMALAYLMQLAPAFMFLLAVIASTVSPAQSFIKTHLYDARGQNFSIDSKILTSNTDLGKSYKDKTLRILDSQNAHTVLIKEITIDRKRYVSSYTVPDESIVEGPDKSEPFVLNRDFSDS